MELLVKKEQATDSGVISTTELLNDYVTNTQFSKVLEHYISNDNLLELLDKVDISRLSIEKVFVNKGVFNINNPINVTAHSSIENETVDNGTLYYDNINDRLRVKTKNGWRTI